jgi:hypothetical protein
MLALPPGVPLTVRVPVFAPAEVGANCNDTTHASPPFKEVPVQESVSTKNWPATTALSRPVAGAPATFLIVMSIVPIGDGTDSGDTEPDATDPNETVPPVGLST